MALIIADRVRDTTTTTGTGNITVTGTAPITYRTFSAVCSVSDTLPYFIASRTLNEWEVGLGTYTSSNTIARSLIYSSSNSGSLVSFSAGTKDVVLSQTAEKMGSGNYTVTSSMPVMDLVQTWNGGAQVFTAAKLNVTDIASATGSNLIDLQVGSVSKFKTDKAGNVTSTGVLVTNNIPVSTNSPTDFLCADKTWKSPSVIAGLILRSNIPLTVIPLDTFITSGFSTEGDLGADAMYTSIGAGPTGPMAIQDSAGTWFNLVLTDVVNVGWCGAKGDGVTDDSSAIKTAIDAAVAIGITHIHFPIGTFIVTTDSVLTPTSATGVFTINFTGASWRRSALQFGTLSSPTWFYDNGATNRVSFATFTDLCFTGNPSWSVYTDISVNANGFKITGDLEQGFKFARCMFIGLNNMFDMEGSNLTSEIKFVECRFYGCRSTFYTINNVQSFNHEFIGCDIEEMFGDVFDIVNGGGAVKMYGGSIVMESATGVDSYFWNLTANAASLGGYPNIFNGLRMELRGDHTNLLNMANNNSQTNVIFASCLFEDFVSVSKANWVLTQRYATVLFRDCGFFEINGGQVLFQVQGSQTFNENGAIVFDSCMIPPDWSDQMSVQFYGLISARNCQGTNIGATGGSGQHWAHDFDLHWSDTGQVASWSNTPTISGDGSPTNEQWRLKVATMKLTSESWKDEQQLKLPLNAIIKNIHLRMPGGGGDGTVITWNVNRNDKTGTPHLTSNSAASSAVHTGDTTNYFYNVGNTTNERNLRLYPSLAVTGSVIRGGIIVVEYY